MHMNPDVELARKYGQEQVCPVPGCDKTWPHIHTREEAESRRQALEMGYGLDHCLGCSRPISPDRARRYLEQRRYPLCAGCVRGASLP